MGRIKGSLTKQTIKKEPTVIHLLKKGVSIAQIRKTLQINYKTIKNIMLRNNLKREIVQSES